MKGENENLRKGKGVADKVIKNLQENLYLQNKDISNLKKISEETERLNFEKEALEKEIIEIQKENVTKEEILVAIKIEMKTYEEKLLKIENKKVEEKIIQTDANKELHNFSIQCDPCGEISEEKGHLDNHHQKKHEYKAKLLQAYRLKENELEEKIHTQKHKLTKGLVELKQTEVFDNFKCICKGFCRIFHHKHNWKKSISKEIVDRM